MLLKSVINGVCGDYWIEIGCALHVSDSDDDDPFGCFAEPFGFYDDNDDKLPLFLNIECFYLRLAFVGVSVLSTLITSWF